MNPNGPDHAGREHGFVIVWFAVVIVLLLAVSAFTIDLLHGYATAQQLQKAADAAATAGVVDLPDLAVARETARDIGASNVDGASFTVVQGASGNQLGVTAKKTIDTFFGGIIGVPELHVTRRSTAEYDPPVRLGSPLNTYGRVAAECGAACPVDTLMWASISGPLTSKHSGDAALAGYCDDDSIAWASGFSYVGGQTDNCAETGPQAGINLDREDAQYFVIDAPGKIKVDLFDPVFVDVNRFCTETPFVSPPAAAARPAGARFDTGASSDYCTGDNDQRWGPAPSAIRNEPDEFAHDSLVQAGNYPVDTTFELFPPDDTPLDPTDNDSAPALCARTWQGYSGWTVYATTPGVAPRYDGFREWKRLCGAAAVGVTGGGKYVLKVSAAAGTEGQNNFAISAYTAGGGRYADPAVSVYALDRLTFFNNVQAEPDFYFARVLPSSVERTLSISLFDAGDTDASGAVAVTIKPAAEARRGGPSGTPITSFSQCRYVSQAGGTDPSSGTTPWDFNAPPFGTPNATAVGCTISNMTAVDFNGQWVSVELAIPADYWCDASTPTGCWLEINFNASSAGVFAADTNTWSAYFAGAPVRIVE